MPDNYIGRPVQVHAVVVGTPKVVRLAQGPIKVGIQGKPGGGGTVTVDTTMSPETDIAAGTAEWKATTIAADATTDQLVLDNVFTAVKLTALVANATFTIVPV